MIRQFYLYIYLFKCTTKHGLSLLAFGPQSATILVSVEHLEQQKEQSFEQIEHRKCLYFLFPLLFALLVRDCSWHVLLRSVTMDIEFIGWCLGKLSGVNWYCNNCSEIWACNCFNNKIGLFWVIICASAFPWAGTGWGCISVSISITFSVLFCISVFRHLVIATVVRTLSLLSWFQRTIHDLAGGSDFLTVIHVCCWLWLDFRSLSWRRS